MANVDNWLAGESLKASADQNAAQQGAFNKQFPDSVSSAPSPIDLDPPKPYSEPLSKKQQLREQTDNGGGVTSYPFKITVINTGSPESPIWKVRVYPSTLAGGSSIDLGFSLADNPPYLLNAEQGVVQGKIIIDENGEVNSRSLEIVNQLSSNTDTNFHVEIGTVAELGSGGFAVSNSRYGPIDVNICRDWFSNPPTYGVTFIGSET